MSLIAPSYPIDPAFPDATTTIADQYPSDEVYGEVVRKMSISCTDAVFVLRDYRGVVKKELYLGCRNVYPMKGVWVIGGRVFFNDMRLEDSVARCVKRETGVAIDSFRFVPISTNFYTWAKVKQHDGPGKNLATLFVCIISEEERGQISAGLTKAEYEPGFGLQRFTRGRLMVENCHPMLLDAYDTLFPSKAQRVRDARAILNNTWWKR